MPHASLQLRFKLLVVAQMNGDGFNGDTMTNIPSDFYEQSRLINHSIALEPEGGGGGVIDGVSTGNWGTMGWGCEYDDANEWRPSTCLALLHASFGVSFFHVMFQRSVDRG